MFEAKETIKTENILIKYLYIIGSLDFILHKINIKQIHDQFW